jgi:phosphoribosylanthranilate isomerase
VQLVDRVEVGAHAAIRRALPQVKIVQVLHVADADVVDEARALAGAVDAFLLDSGNPKLAVKELGGTGRVHDWDLSRRIVEAVDRPVFLAGGLRADNVSEAIARVKPFGVDLCSSVRSEGRLDAAKLASFFAAVNYMPA